MYFTQFLPNVLPMWRALNSLAACTTCRAPPTLVSTTPTSTAWTWVWSWPSYTSRIDTLICGITSVSTLLYRYTQLGSNTFRRNCTVVAWSKYGKYGKYIKTKNTVNLLIDFFDCKSFSIL